MSSDLDKVCVKLNFQFCIKPVAFWLLGMENFERFAANSPDALAAFSKEKQLLFANKRFLELLFLPLSDAKGTELQDLGLPEGLASDLAMAMDAVDRARAERRFTRWEKLVNTRHKFACRVIPASDAGFLTELKLDSTEQSEGNDADNTGTSRFFAILDRFPAFVYMQRQDYTVAYANKRVRDLYGRTESRLCYEVFGGRTSPCPHCPTFDVFETGMPVEWEFTDDMGRTFHIYDYPYEDENGEAMVVELGIDVTELKRVEKELFEARKLRAIGVLAGGMAHDLNNNLVPIIFNIDHALSHVQEESCRETLGEALQAAYRAAKLVEQVLEYSRQNDTKRVDLDFAHIVQRVMQDFRDKLPPDIDVGVDVGARNSVIKANEAQLEQVLANLLHNAVQAMAKGGAINVYLGEYQVEAQHKPPHPDLKPGEYATLRICDTGKGIEKEHIDRIFEPFFTTRKGKGGSGMGLALVYAIVNSAGGVVKVDSTPGIGTCFTLYFPKASSPVYQPMLRGEPCILHSQGGCILLVDDNVPARQAMARTLCDAGFSVDQADTGDAALEMLAPDPGKYGLVLVDQTMPGMSGLEMSKRLLADTPAANVVIYTGFAEPELEEQALAAGVLAIALKPMSPFVLVETVRQYAGKAHA